MTNVPEGGLTISDDGRRAELSLTGVAVVDQPRWPAPNADARGARMEVTIRWEATDEPYRLDVPAKQLRFRGWKATSQLAARVTVPSLGFRWRSDPIETSSAGFAIIGEEENGKYYAPE